MSGPWASRETARRDATRCIDQAALLAYREERASSINARTLIKGASVSPARGAVRPCRNEAEHADVRFLALPRSSRSPFGIVGWRSRPRETRDGHLSRRASVYFRPDKSFSANRSSAIPLRTWRTCRRSGGPRADARDFASPRISMRHADIGARDRREAGCGGDRCVRAAVPSPSWPECNYSVIHIQERD